ncbi:MAG TPA: hypothetical protein VFH89_07490 [Sphingomicrobium sp.]|nr:hypothetical protein [Sphingomicrobium sp.]
MMTRAEPLAHWFEEPAVKVESWAIFWTILAVLVPTLVRAGVDGLVMGCESIAYVPSVLLAAIFLGARHAAIVAVVSAFVSDWMFMGGDSSLLEACDLFGTGVFMLASALIIASVELPRQIPKKMSCSAPDKDPAGIVFSLEKGQAFVSWYGEKCPVRLGPKGEVADMMQDFLAQLEVGERLARGRS